MQNWLFAVGYLLLVGIVVLPMLGAWLGARWTRERVVDHSGHTAALVLAGIFVLAMPAADKLLADEGDAGGGGASWTRPR